MDTAREGKGRGRVGEETDSDERRKTERGGGGEPSEGGTEVKEGGGGRMSHKGERLSKADGGQRLNEDHEGRKEERRAERGEGTDTLIHLGRHHFPLEKLFRFRVIMQTAKAIDPVKMSVERRLGCVL